MANEKAIKSFFDTFSEELAMKVYVKGKEEIFLLLLSGVENSLKPLKIQVLEEGQSAIDFLYDQHYNRVTEFLLNSKEWVRQIKQDPSSIPNWKPFYNLMVELNCDYDLHPFYFIVFREVINAYKRQMRFVNGIPLPDDYFEKIGQSFIALRNNIEEKAEKFFARSAQSYDSALMCYLKEYKDHCVGLFDIYSELVPAEPYEEDKEMTYTLSTVLYPRMPEDIGNYLLVKYLEENVLYLRCENCLRYYVATGRSNVKYCDRQYMDTGKTCRQIMPAINFRSRAIDNPAEKLYNRTYKTMYSRVTAGNMDKYLFKKWSKEARQKRDECKQGIITLEAFAEWLADEGLNINPLTYR